MLYVYYVVVVPLIMLNLLIALMGAKHAKVQEQEDLQGTKLRAELLLSFEKSMIYTEQQNGDWHPMWIHALVPRKQSREMRKYNSEQKRRREHEAIQLSHDTEGSLEDFEHRTYEPVVFSFVLRHCSQ